MGHPIPSSVHGNPVVEVAKLESPALPAGYRPPAHGPALEPAHYFVISVGPGADGEEVYYVSCLDAAGRRVTGDMYYTREAARDFAAREFGIEVNWESA